MISRGQLIDDRKGMERYEKCLIPRLLNFKLKNKAYLFIRLFVLQ